MKTIVLFCILLFAPILVFAGFPLTQYANIVDYNGTQVALDIYYESFTDEWEVHMVENVNGDWNRIARNGKNPFPYFGLTQASIDSAGGDVLYSQQILIAANDVLTIVYATTTPPPDPEKPQERIGTLLKGATWTVDSNGVPQFITPSK